MITFISMNDFKLKRSISKATVNGKQNGGTVVQWLSTDRRLRVRFQTRSFYVGFAYSSCASVGSSASSHSPTGQFATLRSCLFNRFVNLFLVSSVLHVQKPSSGNQWIRRANRRFQISLLMPVLVGKCRVFTRQACGEKKTTTKKTFLSLSKWKQERDAF